MTTWTDTLSEPLATVARGGEWRLINEARGGGWLLLPQESHNHAAWQHLAEDSLDLRPLSPFDDARLKGLAPTVAHHLNRGDSVELLAWRVGKRAVLRVRGAEGDRIVKVYRKDRGIQERWRAFPSDPDDRWKSARVLDWSPGRVALTVEFCTGESMNQRWLEGRGEPADADRIVELLSWIYSRPHAQGLETHDGADEARTLQRRLETFERTLRTPPSRARRLVEVVTRSLILCETQSAPCHRDLHDKQILTNGESGRLIDLDLVAQGPPALDVGNILAHIHLRWLKGVPLEWEEMAGRIATAARRERNLGDSLPVWTASTLLRLALIYARRQRRPELLDRLMDAAEAALESRGSWQL